MHSLFEGDSAHSKTAILLQGPVVTSRDFTVETVFLYRQLFPASPVIVSTWEDADSNTVDMLEHAGAVVSLVARPSFAGLQNINLQIASTSHGIGIASKLGMDYVLKTRTDIRLNHGDSLKYLHAALDGFPVQGTRRGQEARILSASLGTLKYRLFGLGDMIQFGRLNDMAVYWNDELDAREVGPPEGLSHLEAVAAPLVAESWLATRFLSVVNFPHELNWQSHISAMRHCFGIVDSESLGVVWEKNPNLANPWRSHDGNPTFEPMRFGDWLHILNTQFPEDVAPLGARMRAET